MNDTLNTGTFLAELKAETPSTRKCIERISEKTFDFKPHPTSMAMGYLVLLVAEIPSWIAYIIEKGEIDFATYKHADPKSTKEMVQHFEENLKAAENALQNATPGSLSGIFSLKNNGTVLFESPKLEMIGSTLNHWVHHRGQLTVYMRMNEIPVPAIYGPSADDKQY